MIDITERKRAEQALRQSERKYSEAFRREREAAQRLRALDEMKNTFLEAVSHDLRTPLTSILGSALTLEQSELDLPKDDALDLVGRIAANARKLERLLSDLLDLDRLQRGIVDAAAPPDRPGGARAPQRRRDREPGRPRHRGGRRADRRSPSTRRRSSGSSRTCCRTPSATRRRRRRIWVRGFGQDGGVMLIVEDEGPGIPHELHEAVFEPFRQAPGSSSGHSPGRRGRALARAALRGAPRRPGVAGGSRRAAAPRSTCSFPEADGWPVRAARRYGGARGVRVRP